MKKWLLTFTWVLLAAAMAQAAPIIIDLGTAPRRPSSAGTS